MCILFNDWPYGVDPKITHLVVWTKFTFEEDPATGDLTAEARKSIQGFVDAAFHEQRIKDQVRFGSDDRCDYMFAVLMASQVLWFKNWSALKSIHAVEHFHVLLYDAGPGFIKNLTGGDIPLARKVVANGGDKIF